MAGFSGKKDRNVDIEIEDINTDIDDDDYEDDYTDDFSNITKSNNSDEEPNKKEPSRIVRTKKEDNTKLIISVACGVVVVALISGTLLFSSHKKKQNALLLLQQQQEQEANSNSNTVAEVKPGIPNFRGMGEDENDGYLYDPSLITKDLNGNQLPTDYVVVNSEDVTDYINYKKFRASTGNGLEFYWLEAEYKGQPYKVQVPYSIYSKLDYEGITVVDMEVLILEDNSKVVTYMSVRKDAKSLLEDR